MLVLIIIAAVFLYLFCGIKTDKTVKTLIKIVPTTACAVYALTKGSSVQICAGMWICVLADAFLEHRFIPGAVLFAAAHVFFIAGFAVRHTPETLQYLLFAVLCAVFALVLLKGRKKRYREVMLVYGAFLAAMTALASGCGAELACAGILFAFSDSLIAVRMLYGKRVRAGDWLCMGTYYSALILMAAGA